MSVLKRIGGRRFLMSALILLVVCTALCAANKISLETETAVMEASADAEELTFGNAAASGGDLGASGLASAADGTSQDDSKQDGDTSGTQPEILNFVDVHGNPYQVEIQPDWEKHTYEMDGFVHDKDALSYAAADDTVTSRMGVDVSHYQGSIDWEKVKAAGYDFAFIRIGFRGYGEAGTLNADKLYKENLTGTIAAGLDVGVYFFSQAVSEEEAIEEAEYVLQLLDEAGVSISQLTLPVVFDPESIPGDEARTDDVTGEQFTQNAIAFGERIQEAGGTPAIYCNMLWEAYVLNLGELSGYPVWYADYESLPQTPYAFTFWQYSESAHVDGISAAVDVDLWLIN